jgi:NAD(P)-dependent dehydrogenase (short-subunit alcohol dehydrogenase family)
VQAAFREAATRLGGLDAVIHARFDPALLTSRPLLSTPEAVWEEGCEASLRMALFVLQASHHHLRERGGRIILVTPTLSTAGEAGFVPLATAAEAIRILGPVVSFLASECAASLTAATLRVDGGVWTAG